MCQTTVERLFDRMWPSQIRKVASLFAQALSLSLYASRQCQAGKRSSSLSQPKSRCRDLICSCPLLQHFGLFRVSPSELPRFEPWLPRQALRGCVTRILFRAPSVCRRPFSAVRVGVSVVATGDVIAYEGLGLLDVGACPASFEGKASPSPHSGHSSQARSSSPSSVSTK